MSINRFPKSRSLVSPTSSRSVRHIKHLLWIHGWWQYSGKTLSWYWSFQLHLDKLERRGEKLISARGHVWMFNHPLAWSGYKVRYLQFEMINEQSFISAASLALMIINKVRQFWCSSQLKLRLIWDAFFQNHQLLQSRLVWTFSARRQLAWKWFWSCASGTSKLPADVIAYCRFINIWRITESEL